MDEKEMNDWKKWMQFSCRMVIYAMNHHTPERKTKVLKKVVEFINLYRDTKIVGWDADHEDYMCLSDEIDDYFEDGWKVTTHGDITQTRFFRDICCAVRAGIDVVLPDQWQAGVVGFTAGDVRAMYPKGLPQWLQETFDEEYRTPFVNIPNEGLIQL